MSRDSETVSKNMRSIHSKDTSIELQLRKALWHKGYRYRKNYKALPGSPDIVLTKYKIAIFCDSEFFHGLKKLNVIVPVILKLIKSSCFWVIQLYISGVKISKNIPTNVFKLLKKLYGTAPFQILLSIPLTNSIKFMAASFLIQP